MLLLTIVVCTAFFLFSFSGYYFQHVLKIRVENPCLLFWLGVFPIGTLGLLLSCFFPLQGAAALFCFLPSVAGLALAAFRGHRQHLFTLWEDWRWYVWGIVFLAVCFAYKASQGGQVFADDTMGYHLHQVRYLREFGVVLGIGNIHFRLGMNSLWHVLAALLEHGPSIGRSAYVMPALLALGATAWAITEFLITRVVWRKTFIAALFPVFCLSFDNMQPSLYYDYPALFICAIVFYECIKYLISNNTSIESAKLILILTATSFMIKSLNIAFVVFVIFTCVISIIRNNNSYIRSTVSLLIFPAFAAVLWCTKNILLTGYPLYPLPSLALPVDWAMSTTKVAGCLNAILGWARMPNQHYIEALEKGIGFWFKPWLYSVIQNKMYIYTAVIPMVLGLLAWLLVLYNKKVKFKYTIFIFSAVAILSWLFSAPDVRFGITFFWIFFASGISLLCIDSEGGDYFTKLINTVGYSHISKALTACMLLLGVTIFCHGNLNYEKRAFLTPSIAPSGNVREALILPEAGDVFPIFVSNFEGEWTGCANGPVPCTMYPDCGFCLRDANDWRTGFKNCNSRLQNYID